MNIPQGIKGKRGTLYRVEYERNEQDDSVFPQKCT